MFPIYHKKSLLIKPTSKTVPKKKKRKIRLIAFSEFLRWSMTSFQFSFYFNILGKFFNTLLQSVEKSTWYRAAKNCGDNGKQFLVNNGQGSTRSWKMLTSLSKRYEARTGFAQTARGKQIYFINLKFMLFIALHAPSRPLKFRTHTIYEFRDRKSDILCQKKKKFYILERTLLEACFLIFFLDWGKRIFFFFEGSFLLSIDWSFVGLWVANTDMLWTKFFVFLNNILFDVQV